MSHSLSVRGSPPTAVSSRSAGAASTTARKVGAAAPRRRSGSARPAAWLDSPDPLTGGCRCSHRQRGTLGYNLFFLLHILAVLVAFAPAFVWPVLTARAATQGKPLGPGSARSPPTSREGPGPGAGARRGVRVRHDRHQRRGLSSSRQTWISIALLCGSSCSAWCSAAAPDRAQGGRGRRGRRADDAPCSTGCSTCCSLLMLIVMIWKPGL